jgi:hypothetical protein
VRNAPLLNWRDKYRSVDAGGADEHRLAPSTPADVVDDLAMYLASSVL